MLNGTLTYTATMKGLQFEGLELTPNEPGIERVELKSPDGTDLLITVHFAAVASQEEARTRAARLIEPILDQLAFHTQRAIGFPRPLSGAFTEIRTDNSPDRNHFLSDHLCLQDKVTAVVVMHAQSVAQLKAELERPNSRRPQHLAALRSALNAEDMVDCYLSLYRILLDLRRALNGRESQEAVDEFIHREFGEPMVAPPSRPNSPETAYTRLRNEIGHVRPGVVLAQTRTEIRNRVGSLIPIVKRAIELS